MILVSENDLLQNDLKKLKYMHRIPELLFDYRFSEKFQNVLERHRLLQIAKSRN